MARTRPPAAPKPKRPNLSWAKRYEQLLDGLPVAIYIQDEEGKLIASNTAGERLSGFKRAQLLRMNVRQLFTPESHAAVMNLLNRTPPDQDCSTEAELSDAYGGRVPVDLNVRLGCDRAGGRTVQFVARENATRKVFEEALRHSETTFRLMATNLTEMVLAYDMERRLIFANPAAEGLTGYSIADLERAQFICWVHPDDRARMLDHWDKLFEGRSFHEEEYRLVTKDGRQKWVAASWGPILDHFGEQVGVQGRERDVTERRTAEETLRESERRLRVNEERYHTLFENSPFPMWEEDFSAVKEYIDVILAGGVTDLKSHLEQHPEVAQECLKRIKLLDINRSARDFYGAESKEELLGDLTRIFDERANEVFAEEIAALASSRSIFRTEFATRTLRGEERTVTMIVSLAASPNDDWSRVIVSFFDITDRKRLEEQLHQSQKLESLGRLAGGIAHDFNNLLMVINGYADLLLTNPGADGAIRTGLNEIKSAGERGAELTAQLLAFSRKQMAQPRALNLNALIRESEGMLRRVIGEDIELVSRLAPSLWTIKADRGQMHQVLMNLVVNSREAMRDGGTVTIETSNIRLGRNFRVQQQNDPESMPYVRIRVQDTGAGMDERTMQHLFEPFFTTKRSGKGTGLGLATVFGIVTQSGGQISVTSEPGSGSTFDVFLPSLSGLTESEPDGGVRTAAARGFGAVLVVEDQEEVRTLCCAILREAGYEVLEAGGGSDALAIAERYGKPIRLLLTDVIMPGMNGRELSERLTRARPGLMVLYMSGYTDRIMSESGVLDTSVAYLQKPFTPVRLVEMVQQVLSAAAE